MFCFIDPQHVYWTSYQHMTDLSSSPPQPYHLEPIRKPEPVVPFKNDVVFFMAVLFTVVAAIAIIAATISVFADDIPPAVPLGIVVGALFGIIGIWLGNLWLTRDFEQTHSDWVSELDSQEFCSFMHRKNQ